ncbi:hypothetical protein HHK36_027905 [Tetracentron sinense]|uniref:Uncharacterized protein n=1 Tax=Tetracentron sinense TaxID=13715 RepID=A0A834YFM6_TETSI|nr:hypothetical protein HHK36_027905 [Tetracentron sinense]
MAALGFDDEKDKELAKTMNENIILSLPRQYAFDVLPDASLSKSKLQTLNSDSHTTLTSRHFMEFDLPSRSLQW